MENHKNFSENEQMYLVTIAQLDERGDERTVPLAKVANELEILPVSANQMVRKLEKNGLVRYTPYKGVELTKNGSQIAAQILRQRWLWEVFLVEHLGYTLSETDEITCRLEHIFPEAAAERLAEFLAYPRVSPSGNLIPDLSPQAVPMMHGTLLSTLRAGESGEILYIEGQAATQAFLHAEGFVSGAELHVEAVGAEGVMLVVINPARAVSLSSTVAGFVWVKPTLT